LTDLWGQRRRWRIGHLEVLLKALRGGFQNGGVRGVMSTSRLFTELAANLFLVCLAAKVLVLFLLDLEFFFLLPFLAIAVAVAPVLVHDLREGHVETLTPSMALVPLIYPAFGLLVVRAAFAYALSWDGEWFEVDKSGS
jgi:cellulose synthase/poly-beta-1,6-N-acetylglucosamine synthase-like glycosyltransferase